MNTQLLDANNPESIAHCAQILRAGGLVAFPTETVYGLGACGTDGQAIQSIFTAKGRPSDNPLILHIAEVYTALELFSSPPPFFDELTRAFFPGALTLIYYKAAGIPSEVTAGLDTVAVRMPSNRYANALIRACGVPVAAPSANSSGKPSPTTAAHVMDDLSGKIDAVLDGGSCEFGLESTVLSLTDKPTILRPGGVTREMLEQVIGKVEVAQAVLQPYNGTAQSPGMKYKHYAPQHAIALAITGTASEIEEKTMREYDMRIASGKSCVILASADTAIVYGERNVRVIGHRCEPELFCNALFGELRSCNSFDYVLCETLPTDGLGLAYMNRLLRACAFVTV